MKTLRLLSFTTALLVTVASSAWAESPRAKPAKPEHIAHGAEVKITDYLVPGKTTIIDFTSEYCPPCRAVAPMLDKLHQTRDDIVVVSVDINRPNVKGIDWKSPVARQYQLESVPNFKVFNPEGKLIVEGKPASQLVYSWLQ